MSFELNLDNTDERIMFFLHIFKRDDGAQNKELIKFTKVAPSTLSLHIDALLKNGLIERVQKEKNSKY